MSDWGTYIDRSIRKAMEDGEFSNLPGEGKPLKLDNDPYTPDDMQLAYKILRDNDLAPDWIMHGKELGAKHEGLLDDVRRAVRNYQRALTDPHMQARADGDWQNAKKRLTTAVEKLNSEILSYNLKVPRGVTHRPLINLEREIQQILGRF